MSDQPRPEDLPPMPASEPMSRVDLAWLRMDEPSNLMTITGLMPIDGDLGLEDLRRVVEDRMASIPRFRQRAVRTRLGARWVEDPGFDVAHHVVREVLPEPGDEGTLQARVGELMAVPLDPSRPLWQLQLIENFQGGSVVVGRIHHCIGDGVALMMVLLSLTDLEGGEAAELISDGHANPLRELFRVGSDAVEAAIEHARQVMPETMKLVLHRTGSAATSAAVKVSRSRLALRASAALGRLTFLPPDPRTLFKGPLGVAKKATWSEAVPFEQVQGLRATIGGTVNDVLLTAMTGGLRHYLEARGHRVEGLNFRAAVPVSLRPAHKLPDLGNQFGLVFLSLPVGIAEPRERLAELRRRMEALKGSLEAGVAFGILHGMGLSPVGIQRLITRIFGTKATAVMTNVPGPRRTLYLAGRPIRDLLFWVPQSGRLGLGISILSYDGRVRLGVTTDAGLVPDPEVIVEGFHRELERMLKLG